MLFVEDEALFGIVEDTGFEEDGTFGLDVTEEPPVVFDDDELPGSDAAEDELLPDSADEVLLEDELLVSAEDTIFEEELTADELFSASEAVSLEVLSKLIVIFEFDESPVSEQPVISNAAADAKHAHIILFILNTLSLIRRSQRPRQQTKRNPLAIRLR